MLFGGTGAPFGRSCSNALHLCDVKRRDEGFERVETVGPAPLPQYGQAAFYRDGYFYAIGGTDGQIYSIDIHRLDLQNLIWEIVFAGTGNAADEPEPRYRHELAVDGNDLYILAGGTAERAFDFVQIPVFNLETQTWTFRKSIKDRLGGYPSPRKCHSAVQIESNGAIQVFIMGGFNNLMAFDDLWRLEIPSLHWTRMRSCSFPRELYFHSSTVTPEGCMYTFGGIQYEDQTTARSDKLYKVWLRVPELLEICWEAMLHCFPTIVDIDQSKLLKMGIPLRLAERLKD